MKREVIVDILVGEFVSIGIFVLNIVINMIYFFITRIT